MDLLLGSGLTGDVYKHCATNANGAAVTVAVKRVLGDDTSAALSINREAYVLCYINNACTHALLSADPSFKADIEFVVQRIPGYIGIAGNELTMEFIEGMSLYTYLDAHKADLSAVTLYGILHQIIKILATLQTIMPHFTHGDLHPRNILVTEIPGVAIPRVSIVDFESATVEKGDEGNTLLYDVLTCWFGTLTRVRPNTDTHKWLSTLCGKISNIPVASFRSGMNVYPEPKHCRDGVLFQTAAALLASRAPQQFAWYLPRTWGWGW